MATSPPIPRYLAPFQLLELNIISAQDLQKVSRKMKTYAVVWIHPDRKLYTRVETCSHNNPTWNDKFVFRVDNSFLYDDLSAINIEIYATSWWRDIFVGSVRVLVGNLLKNPKRRHEHSGSHFLGMQFVALQVRRPSSRFQGILNIGLALLDSSMRSMPLYSQQGTSAVAYKDLIEGYPFDNNQHVVQNFQKNEPRELRRTKSDSSSMVASMIKGGSMMDDSVVIKGQKGTASSWLSGSSILPDVKAKKVKNGSWLSGSDLGYMQKFAKSNKGSSILSASETTGRYGRASSLITGSEINFPAKKGRLGGQQSPSGLITIKELVNMKTDVKSQQNGSEVECSKPKTITQYDGSDVNVPIITESELGPSPSEVAAAMEQHRYKHENVKINSSAAGWSLETGSVEGLQSKLARWRAELPPVYDRSTEYSSIPSVPLSGSAITRSSGNTTSKHRRRHTHGGDGLVSCFGNLCGMQVSIVCGTPSKPVKKKDKSP